jgi:hypothetical protein
MNSNNGKGLKSWIAAEADYSGDSNEATSAEVPLSMGTFGAARERWEGPRSPCSDAARGGAPPRT